MFGMRRCRWRLTPIATAAATWIGIAQAHQIIYDHDGYKLAVGIEAGFGGFAVGNVDTGAGCAARGSVLALRASHHEGLIRRLYQAVRRTGNGTL
jgi:hypothetical protein